MVLFSQVQKRMWFEDLVRFGLIYPIGEKDYEYRNDSFDCRVVCGFRRGWWLLFQPQGQVIDPTLRKHDVGLTPYRLLLAISSARGLKQAEVK